MALTIAVTGIFVGSDVFHSSRAGAATAAAFDPGNIMSDQVFYDSSTMTQTNIQDFFGVKEPVCTSSYACLKNFVTYTGNKPAVANRCNGYSSLGIESAAQIVYRVSQSCGINPRVLLVLLQKEQGLITATNPTPTQFRIATGYGCPDTAACDSTYYGFFNQVYQAAYQFKIYRGSPNSFNFRAGRTNMIAWSPNAACGSGPVYIANQATAGLYNYTPYQPNAAAMANLYGSGDGCSAYGNRNFWRYYSDWFGQPTNDLHVPVGSLDSAQGANGVIDVNGWAYDPDDTAASLQVHFYVDGVVTEALTANGSRPDVEASHPGAGANHGFSGSVPASPGVHTICVYAINIGAGYGNPQLGCASATVKNASPVGALVSVTPTPGVGMTVSGWAVDPDTTGPITVHVYVDGAPMMATTAGLSSSAVPPAIAGSYGTAHGYSATVVPTPGQHQFCTWGINVGNGSNTMFGCTTAVWRSGPPITSFDSVTTGPGVQTVTGWAFDPDTTSPIAVHVYADGVFQKQIMTGSSRPDVAAGYPGYAGNPGFQTTLSLSGGTHQVCLYALNVGPGGNVFMGCKSVVVDSGAPHAGFDSVSPVPGGEKVTGWALDPDTADPITVHVYADGVFQQAVSADESRPAVAAAYPGYGDRHGFSATLSLSTGSHSVCVYALNVGPGGNLFFGCKSIVVSDGAPVGAIDSVTGSSGAIAVKGWSVDPDTDAPVTVHAYIDGVFSRAITADGPMSAAGVQQFPAWSVDHGFDVSLPSPAGAHDVCLYALSIGRGGNRFLGCTQVSVP